MRLVSDLEWQWRHPHRQTGGETVGERGKQGRQQLHRKEGQVITLGNTVTTWMVVRRIIPQWKHDAVSEGEPWDLRELLQPKLSGLVTLVDGDVV